MKCPRDGADTRVLSTRGERRRRECLHCGHRFTTFEVITTRNELLHRQRVGAARSTLVRLGLLQPQEP